MATEGAEVLMPSRYSNWLAQGLRDLKAARSMLDGGFYEWAAFQAHQAAEKGLKAVPALSSS